MFCFDTKFQLSYMALLQSFCFHNEFFKLYLKYWARNIFSITIQKRVIHFSKNVFTKKTENDLDIVVFSWLDHL